MIIIKSVLFISFLCRVPLGRSSLMSECHGTTPSACTVLSISHPVGVIYRSPLKRMLLRDQVEVGMDGGRGVTIHWMGEE
jgi:hypothetical protein